MSLKNKIYKRLLEYQKDVVFNHRFSKLVDSEIVEWTDALYKNNIVFIAADMQFHFDDFKKMDFTGPEINHQEWQQQINRFFWLKFATIEYQKNKSDHMANIVFDTVNAWMDFWPNYGELTDIYPFRQHEFWDPMINTSIRLGFNNLNGWVGCVPHFFSHPLFTEEFVEKMVECILWQIKPMVYNNRYRGGENNWRPNELDSILFISQVIPGAEKYQEYAVSHLNDAFISQFESDGSHIEHTDDYHNWMSDVFANLAMLAKKRPSLGLKIDLGKIIKIMDYGLICKAPDGRSFGIHDSQAWHENNPTIIYDYLDKRDKIASLINQLTFKEKYKNQFDVSFLKARQFFLRTSWDYDATMVYFDASKWGGWHTHMSRNSVNIYHGNKMIITDPGTLNYGNNLDREYGKSTCAHNTITIDNMTQNISSNPEIEHFESTNQLSLIISDYTGGYKSFYDNSNAIVAEHERIFLWVKNHFMLVFDNINIQGNTTKKVIASHWQYKAKDVFHDSNKQLSHSIFSDYNILIKKVYSNVETSSTIYKGQKDPMLGYNSKTGNKLSGSTPAPMFSIEAETNKDVIKIGQLIIPYKGDIPPNVSVTRKKTNYALLFNILIDDYKFEVVSHYFVRDFLKSNSAIREIEEFNSFARFIVNGYKNNKRFLKWSYMG
ncbi:MAG: heparinase II/III family protein [Clostridiales bacterium]|nr:heparinase II/III family protein [Clostridiales bacterium]